MKIFLLVAIIIATSSMSAIADVGISVNVGEPGFYGQLNVGGFPAPQLIYNQPIIVQEGGYERPPIYLHVPPGQIRHWRRYCGRYNACGERVFFVRDDWYNQEYAPRYQAEHRDGHWHDHGDHGHDHGDHGHDHGDNGHDQ